MADVKILLVEDENIDAMDIKDTLQSFGYTIPYIASRGDDALKKIIDLMPDLVLIDIILKGDMDGIQLASKLTEFGIPFIFITAYSDESTVERAMATGPYGYLVKPFEETKLKFSIEHALYRKKMEIESFKQIALTKAINRVLRESLTCKSAHDVANICLEVAEDITGSKFGFISEVNPSGRFDTISISNPVWNECVMPETKAVKLIVDMDIKSYWGRVIKSGKPVIVNNPLSDPDRLGEPEGHPQITSFLGVPLKQSDVTMGMIALANKETNYNQDDLKAIETLSTTFLEVIHRKKAEENLQRSEERFRVVAESAVDAIVTTDVNGIIRFFNNSLQNIFGYTSQELTGKPLTTLMPERYRDNYLHELERFKKSGKHRLIGKTVTTTGLKKNGTEFPFEMSLSSWKSAENTYFTSIIRDLTEKKKAEEELRWSNDRLMMGMDIAKLVYWEYNITSDMFTFDDQFYALYGTSAKKEGGYKMSSQEYATRFIPPEEAALVGEEVAKAIETDDPDFSSTVQHSIIRADGGRRFIIVRIRLIFDEDDNKIGAYGVNQDITELKMAENALMESKRRLADIIDFLPDATFAIDHMGRVISWNRAIEEMTGVQSEEILGKGNYEYSLPFYGIRRPILIDLVKADEDEISNHYRVKNRKGNMLTAETETFLKGEVRTMWGKAVPFHDNEGNFIGAIEAIRDITEIEESRRKINRELAINKSLANIYAPLVSPSSTIEDVGQVILEEAKKLTESPYGFVSMIDQSRTDNFKQSLTINAPDSENLILHLTDNNKNTSAGLLNYLRSKKPILTNSPDEDPFYEEIPPDHVKLVKLLSMPVFLGEDLVGQITLANATRDYTKDDLDAIERLAVFYALAIQNKRTEQEIKESLKDKELLLREVHHRVKNNMQIISSLLNLQMQQVNEEKAENVLKESQGRVKSMSMVHENLYQSPSFTKIDFKDYIEKLVTDIFYSYGIPSCSNIKIKMDIDDIQIGIDTAIPCGLIINELVTNSVKYAFPEGEGTLNIELKTHSDFIELVIADNGIGLPDDIDFRNTDSLGLQLVNNLVGQIEGEITLDQSQGTEFKITFKELKYKKRL